VGLNYKSHIDEMGEGLPQEPTLFLKPRTAVIGPGESILLPPQSSRVDYEGELAVVIKDHTRWVSQSEAHKHVLGTPLPMMLLQEIFKVITFHLPCNRTLQYIKYGYGK